MARKSNHTPTKAELEILQILWQKSPATVKEIHEQILLQKEVGYTTTLKIMQNMASKGFLNRTLDGKSHRYSPAIEESQTKTALLDRFLDNAFGGSVSGLVMQLLGNGKTTRKELKEIKEIIQRMEDHRYDNR